MFPIKRDETGRYRDQWVNFDARGRTVEAGCPPEATATAPATPTATRQPSSPPSPPPSTPTPPPVIVWAEPTPAPAVYWVCRPNAASPAGFDFLPVGEVREGDTVVVYEDDCPNPVVMNPPYEIIADEPVEDFSYIEYGEGPGKG